MAFRGTESPMDFEWQGHGPVDPNSPFHKHAMENQRKRMHAELELPQKASIPSLRAPNSQPFFFSNAPTAPAPSPFRNPSFTTPRKPLDFDFSSGPEDSPADQADPEDTPEAKTAPIDFTANKSTNKRNSLFGLYGRFAPSPGRGEIKKPYSNAIAKRIQRRRRKAQAFDKELVLSRRGSEDSSDDEDRPDSSDSKAGSKQQSKVHEVGWITGLFTFIHTYPDAPAIIAKYLQLFFNAAIFAGCLYLLLSFYRTIQADVDRASEDAVQEVLLEVTACAKHYVDFRCAADTRIPSLEASCNNWELCMNRDVGAIKRARLSAHTFAEIFNSFVEPISLKTMLFTITLVVLGVVVNNVTFSLYRRSHEQHSTDSYRQPSGSYMHSGSQAAHFPQLQAAPGQSYGQHNYGWQDPNNSQFNHRLEYQRSPSKEYGRSRSRSPEKKKIML